MTPTEVQAMLWVGLALVAAAAAIAAIWAASTAGLDLIDEVATRSVTMPTVKTEKPKRGPKFRITQDAAGEWRFALVAGNGEIVAAGEGYKTQAGARRGAEAVRRAAAEAEVVVE